jgi:hypothetical protein
MKRTGIRSMSAKRRQRLEGPTAPRERHPVALHRVERSGVYAGTTTGPAPKEAIVESAAYERAAKSLGYCMRCGAEVVPLTGALDFCHADLGKGQGIKTDVRRGWPGCRTCHEIVGRKLAKPVRRAVEYLLGVMTRAAVRAAGKWPKGLPMFNERSA